MTRRSGRPLLGLVLLALTVGLLAGCDSQSAIPKDKLSALVLSQKDMPSGFSEFYNGPQVRLDNQGTVRSNATRAGRQGGWIPRLRAGSGQTSGPLGIESRAELLKESAGGRSGIAAYAEVVALRTG